MVIQTPPTSETTLDSAGFEYKKIKVNSVKIVEIENRWNVIYTVFATNPNKLVQFLYKHMWNTDSKHVDYIDAYNRVQVIVQSGYVQRLVKKNQTFTVPN